MSISLLEPFVVATHCYFLSSCSLIYVLAQQNLNIFLIFSIRLIEECLQNLLNILMFIALSLSLYSFSFLSLSHFALSFQPGKPTNTI